jgi:hypothetical protein
MKIPKLPRLWMRPPAPDIYRSARDLKIPRYMGLAYDDAYGDRTLWVVMPFNLVVRAAVWLYLFMHYRRHRWRRLAQAAYHRGRKAELDRHLRIHSADWAMYKREHQL